MSPIIDANFFQKSDLNRGTFISLMVVTGHIGTRVLEQVNIAQDLFRETTLFCSN